MPIFEYRCKDCDNKFQKLIRSGQAEINCPECGSKDVTKLFSTFACCGTDKLRSSSGGGCSSCSGGSCSTCH